jgi:hypothetical protein
VKNQWIETKFEIDRQLVMAKQSTKYQMNICKHSQTDILDEQGANLKSPSTSSIGAIK